MEQQNYNNHRRFYPQHHFVLLPLIFFLLVYSLFEYFANSKAEFGMYSIIFFLIGWVAVMLRQHYALNNQNRIVRLEMRLRYYQLTHERFEPIEAKLSFGQIAALRFASDEELLDLTDKTLKNNLSAKEIKKSIKNWYPDHMRV